MKISLALLSLSLFTMSTAHSAYGNSCGIKEYLCQVNFIEQDCYIGEIFQLNDNLNTDLNQFTVTVIDQADNMASLNHQGEVYETYLSKDQSISIGESDNDIDVLFVVDNSNSMKGEQRHLAERVHHFIDHIVDLDWSVAVTSTDPNIYWDKPIHPVIGGDGKLFPFPNNNFFLDETVETELANDYLGETLVGVGYWGSVYEQGIRAIYRAIERSQTEDESNQPNRDFFRDSSALAVVLISDEDEYTGDEDYQPNELIQLIQNTWGTKKDFIFNAIIVKEGDSDCKESTGGSPGIRYAQLSQLTNGVVSSICESDYASQLSDIGKIVRDQVTEIELECQPIDRDKDGQVDINIHLEDGSEAPGFTLNGKTLVFRSNLPIGNHNIQYYCEKPANGSD